MKKWIYITIFYTNFLMAQKPFMLHLTNDDGLPSMTIYQVIQDKDGYIWIGSANGLSRYDGRNFISLDLSNLLDKEIVFLQEDYLGRIWLNNLSGQIGWVENMEFQMLNLPDLPENVLPMRFIISDSTLFLNYWNNIRQFSIYDLKSNGKFARRAFINKHLLEPNIERVHFNDLYFFQRIMYEKGKFCYKYLQNDSLKEQCNDHYFEELAVDDGPFILLEIDNQGRFLLKNKEFLIRYDRVENKSELIYNCLENPINDCLLRDNEIWLFTKNGIITIDEKNLKNQTYFLNGINSHLLFEDRENNLWLPTSSNGIFLMSDMNIKTFNAQNSNLAKKDVHSLYYDKPSQSLFIGMSGGYFSKYDIAAKKFTNFILPLSGRVVAIEKDQEGLLWVGLDDGIFKINTSSGEIINTNLKNTAKVIKEDSKYRLWLGFSHYLLKQNPGEKPKEVLVKRISSIVEDSKSHIWIGTTDGLYIHKNDSLSVFSPIDKKISYNITGIEPTKDSSLWIAKANDGLMRIKNDQIVQHVSRKDGLISNNCRSLYLSNNKLLVGTDNGLSRIDIETNEIDNINIRDGLPSGEINCVVSDGTTIWMGTPNGLAEMRMDYIPKNNYLPTIMIEALSGNGKKLSLTGSLELPHWQNTLDFEYVGIDIKSNQKESYKYRMIGLNNNWHSTASRLARFHTLKPGDYTFQVKTINDIGEESLNSADVEFSIKKPWWESVWFYLSFVLFSGVIIGSVIFWRVNEKRKREKIENELNKRIQILKSEALKSQMNPHFIYNALNSIQDFFITHDDESALMYLSKFAHMIRLIFEYSSRDTISLQDEIEFINLYLDLEKLRFGDRVKVIFEIENELQKKLSILTIPPLLLQPIIENVFKHGLMHKLEGGEAKIHFSEVDGHIRCIIEDNGIGRKISNQMKNWRQRNRDYGGLDAVEERLSIWRRNTHKKPLEIVDLEDGDGKPLGTRIIINI